jgi:hypothetical protein
MGLSEMLITNAQHNENKGGICSGDVVLGSALYFTTEKVAGTDDSNLNVQVS